MENIYLENTIDLSKYNILGDAYELIISLGDFSKDIEIDLRKNGNERTTFSFDSIKKKASLNRNFSGYGYKGIRKCYLKDLKKIHIFVDKCSVEIFLNDGEEVFTGNIYPNKDSLGIEIRSKMLFTIPKIEFYKF